MKLRATPSATGDGIRIARDAGAKITEIGAFYGHILAREAMTDDRLWPYPNIDIAATASISSTSKLPGPRHRSAAISPAMP